MKYKAKKSYNDLPSSENLQSLGMGSKHIWLIEGLEITFNGELPDSLKDHLIEVKEKAEVKQKIEKKGDK